MPRVLQSPDAIREIRGIVDYIAADNPAAAERWYRELDHVFQLLAAFPEVGHLFRGQQRTFRRAACGNYVIYYRPHADGVEIVHVIHGARDHERLV